MSTSLSSLHTTLAQDAYRLYYGVIDYVSKNLRNDLISDGKSAIEADDIIQKLTQKWKDKLRKSKCIDGGGLLGVNDTTPNNIETINVNNPFRSIINNNNDNNNDNRTDNDSISVNLPPMIDDDSVSNKDSIYTPPPYLELMNTNWNNNGYNGTHGDGPARKRQKLDNTLDLPQIIPPKYPNSNPHIRGMGVPNIDQIHNPFTNPRPNISQHDGPLPMLSNNNNNSNANLVGFSDDDDDIKTINTNITTTSTTTPHNNSLKNERNDEKTNTSKNTKSEDNNNNDINTINPNECNDNNNNNTIDNDDSFTEPLIINGRDLNGPLNSDDDDNDDDINLNPDDKIYCQFIKVNRRKNEWSVELKNGIMHINGKDYAFIKAQNGKFVWD
mmetsp:Transcript_62321/g.76339  ORF Transcript_62321/g.76339 Transcript_62321/m.76339 type:complete len:385 (-) Transcript_62321:77-1231(-)